MRKSLKKWLDRYAFVSMIAVLLCGAYLIVGGLIFREWRDVLIGFGPWLIAIPYWSSRRRAAASVPPNTPKEPRP